MNKLIITLGICLAFASGNKLPAPTGGSEKHIGCYYLNGPVPEDPQDDLKMENIDASLCTHLYSDYIPINADASVKTENTGYDLDEFRKFKDSQKKNKDLKAIISMGGLPGTAGGLIKILAVPNLRQKFSNNVVNFVKKYKFNGIDIDLRDYDLTKAEIVGLASNQKNFVLLLKAMREKFDREGYILSLTVGATEAVAKLFDIKGVSKYVDFMNLKAFDFHNVYSADKKVGHSAPMYFSSKENAKERELNVDYTVKHWISKGVPPNKLILGIAFYANGYTLANPKVFGRGARFSGESTMVGDYEMPTVGYYEICSLTKTPQWKHLYDKEQQVPYIYNADQIIAYDDVESITKKVEYSEKMKLGGVFVWGIEQDDVGGKCGEKLLLLKTVNRVLGHKC